MPPIQRLLSAGDLLRDLGRVPKSSDLYVEIGGFRYRIASHKLVTPSGMEKRAPGSRHVVFGIVEVAAEAPATSVTEQAEDLVDELTELTQVAPEEPDFVEEEVAEETEHDHDNDHKKAPPRRKHGK